MHTASDQNTGNEAKNNYAGAKVVLRSRARYSVNNVTDGRLLVSYAIGRGNKK